MAGSRRNSAHHLNTTNASVNSRAPEPLPPDVAAARKNRINNDLVTLFKRPCSPNSQPTAQGIGLYTHIKGPLKTPQFPHERFLKSSPVFLPIGGPRRIGQSIKLDSHASNEVKEAWKVVKEAVEEEEKVAGIAEMTAEELKERYGSLDAPKQAPSLQSEVRMRQLQLNEQDASMQDAIANQTTSATPVFGGRRASLGNELRRRSTTDMDVTMGGTDQARRGSLPRTGNIYHENRDPRLRGR